MDEMFSENKFFSAINKIMKWGNTRDDDETFLGVIVRTNDPYETLVETVLESELGAINISGPHGCGKTYFASRLVEDSKVKGVYGDIYYTSARRSPDQKHFIAELCGVLNNKKPIEGDIDITTLKYSIEKRSPLMLIIDDVPPQWGAFMVELDFSIVGYKLVVISTSKFSRFNGYQLKVARNQDRKMFMEPKPVFMWTRRTRSSDINKDASIFNAFVSSSPLLDPKMEISHEFDNKKDTINYIQEELHRFICEAQKHRKTLDTKLLKLDEFAKKGQEISKKNTYLNAIRRVNYVEKAEIMLREIEMHRKIVARHQRDVSTLLQNALNLVFKKFEKNSNAEDEVFSGLVISTGDPYKDLLDLVVKTKSHTLNISGPSKYERTRVAGRLMSDSKLKALYRGNVYCVSMQNLTDCEFLVPFLCILLRNKITFEKDIEDISTLEITVEEDVKTLENLIVDNKPVIVVILDAKPQWTKDIKAIDFEIKGYKLVVTSKLKMSFPNGFDLDKAADKNMETVYVHRNEYKVNEEVYTWRIRQH